MPRCPFRFPLPPAAPRKRGAVLSGPQKGLDSTIVLDSLRPQQCPMSPAEFQQTVRTLDVLFSDGVAVYARPSFGNLPRGSVDSEANRYYLSGDWPEGTDDGDLALGTLIVDPENGIYDFADH